MTPAEYSSTTLKLASLIADYDAADGQRSLINDIAIGAEFAYTDSFRPVNLSGETFDGLLTLNLDETGLTGAVTSRDPLDDLRYPTTLALSENEYIIVNSQLNMSGGTTNPPRLSP